MTTLSHNPALYNKEDRSSLSNPHQVSVSHINIVWDIDFAEKVFRGAVDLSVKVIEEGTAEVHLDSSRLHLSEDAVLVNHSEKAAVRVEETHPVLGTRIAVAIPPALRSAGSTFTVSIKYAIDAEASAVQWLAAEATKGGVRPFVFTQCQAIHARSLLPCMDSPAVKTTYTAAVTAPQWCTVLMSALADGEREGENETRTFLWRQPVPTPAYLIALAAGRVESRDVSDRVRIWAEPEVISAAHYEFDETEDFVRIAEEITGCPYQWTRYDVVCLPPSFPYGGMENPCLTFATPTLLAGDKSLADVIAHEIAHSWTGNLVTNHTWDHFWLNEGWTVWLERKITSRFKKNREVGVLSAQIGYKDLQESVKNLKDASRFTRLVWPLCGEDPDDAFSSVPYEKGFNLLNQLETIVGTELFEAFAQRYIDSFKFGTVTTGEFRDCFVAFIHEKLDVKSHAAEGEDGTHAEGASEKAKTATNKKNKKKGKSAAPAPAAAPVVQERSPEHKQILEKVDALDWDQLFLSEGMPAFVPDFENSLSAAAQALAKRWTDAALIEDDTGAQFAQFSAKDIDGWTSAQLCLFIEALQRVEQWDLSVLERIDAVYSLTARLNAEIRLRWQILCLRADAEWIIPHVLDFVTSQGRMKFVRPLYRALRLSRVGRTMVQGVFNAHKHVYHPIARKMLETDLEKLASIPGIDAEADAEEEEEATEAVQTSEQSENDTAPSAAVESEREPAVQAEEVPVVVAKEEETLSVAATTVEASPTAEEETVPVAAEPEPVVAVGEKKEVVVPAVEETVAPAPAPVVVEEEAVAVPAPVAVAAVEEEPVIAVAAEKEIVESVSETVSSPIKAAVESVVETVTETVAETVAEEPVKAEPVVATVEEVVASTPAKARSLTEEDSQPASEPQQSPVPTPKPAQKSAPVEEAQSATPLAKLNVTEEVKYAAAPVPVAAPATPASAAPTPVKEEKILIRAFKAKNPKAKNPPTIILAASTPAAPVPVAAPATPASAAPTPVKEKKKKIRAVKAKNPPAIILAAPTPAAKPSCCGDSKKEQEKESTTVSTQRSYLYLYLLGFSGIVGFYLFRTLSRRR